MDQGTLNDLRVLDFTRVLAGPYATRILGDFGAEVIKVQSKKVTGAGEDNNGAYFNTWNRNKLSITLDMNQPEAREVACKLVAKSDVVIENFSPRVMSNWGWHYEGLREIKKDLIMVSMSGMGQTGPWRDFAAFGPTIQSLCGLTFLTSYDKNFPVGLGYSYADAIAGLYGALAVLAALEYRHNTGLGQFIDLSEYEAACTLIGSALLDLTANQTEVRPHGNRSDHVPAAPYNCYPCLGDDRWCAIAIFEEHEWEALCKIMGDPSWAKDNIFSTMVERKRHEDELDKHIEKWTINQRAEEIVQCLQEANVSSGIVQNAEDLASDPHLLARSFFKEINHPTLGTTTTDRCPILFKGTNEGPWKPSPLLGEDNQYIYRELLGLSEDLIGAYIEKGIIA
jgi:crotonobetainyl-CoA:carnitine CoA-transferase CaiB-like acyl-CoA transferase